MNLKKHIKRDVDNLTKYKEQLLARHKEEPLKSPPLFLLNSVISDLEYLLLSWEQRV